MRSSKRWVPGSVAVAIGVVVAVTLGATAGYFYDATYESRVADAQSNGFVLAAREAAVDLTSVDFRHVDADVARILATATGIFRDDFIKRSKQFIEMIEQTQSASVGTVTEAALESSDRDEGQVLVAVEVTTSVAGQPQTERPWRIRVDVERMGDTVKVANVQFVP